jgi:hypothetical protein
VVPVCGCPPVASGRATPACAQGIAHGASHSNLSARAPPCRRLADDNNYYLGTLFQLDKDADTREVLLGRGDVTMNDDPQLGTLRSTLAEVIAQCLETQSALDVDFTVVNAKGEFPDVATLRERLASL